MRPIDLLPHLVNPQDRGCEHLDPQGESCLQLIVGVGDDVVPQQMESLLDHQNVRHIQLHSYSMLKLYFSIYGLNHKLYCSFSVVLDFFLNNVFIDFQ